MALKNMVDSLDGVNEKFHAFYTEQDGKFVLDEALQAEDTTALKNAKEHEKQERLKLQTKLEKQKQKEEQWEIEKAELEGRTADAERLKQEALDRQKSAYEKQYQEELASRDKRIHDLTIGKLKSEIAAQVYVKPDVMNLGHLDERIKLDDKDNAYIIDANGASMSINDYVAELRDDKSMAMFIKAGDGKGGGTPPPNTNPGGKAMTEREEKMAKIKAANPDLA